MCANVRIVSGTLILYILSTLTSTTGNIPSCLRFMCLVSVAPDACGCALLGRAGVFVHSIATGPSEYQDVWSSFYSNMNQQVSRCSDTQQHPSAGLLLRCCATPALLNHLLADCRG